MKISKLRFFFTITAFTGVLLAVALLVGGCGSKFVPVDTQIFINAAHSFSEQVTGGKYHATAAPVITIDSKQIKDGKMEVMVLMKTMTSLNSGPIDNEPIIAGELLYLKEHSTTLSSVAKKAVEDDIAYWRGAIKSAMTGSSETNYIIKIVGDVNTIGNIDVGSLQVYVDEGAPKGNAWVLAEQYLLNMRSGWVTVRQGYDSAAALVSITDSKAEQEGPKVDTLMLTNVTDSDYDAVPLTWNVGQNTLQSSGKIVLHADNTNGEAKLCWSPGTPATPIYVVQQWSHGIRLPLLTETAASYNVLNVFSPPEGIQYASTAFGYTLVRWYSGENESFIVTQSEIEVPTTQLTPKTNLNGMNIKITERSIWQKPEVIDPPKDKILTVSIPDGLVGIDVLYGSGGVDNGFILVQEDAPFGVESFWLIRMNNGKGTMLRCGDEDAFGGNSIVDQDPSFARNGSLLYFTHGHTKIGCIDTAAASPSVTFPEKINNLLTKLFTEGPQGGEGGPIQAQLAYDGALIIEYPDIRRNSVYYALDESGIVLGSLRVDKDSITSLNAQGGQGSTLKTPGSPGYVSFPSYDLFQWNVH